MGGQALTARVILDALFDPRSLGGWLFGEPMTQRCGLLVAERAQGDVYITLGNINDREATEVGRVTRATLPELSPWRMIQRVSG